MNTVTIVFRFTNSPIDVIPVYYLKSLPNSVSSATRRDMYAKSPSLSESESLQFLIRNGAVCGAFLCDADFPTRNESIGFLAVAYNALLEAPLLAAGAGVPKRAANIARMNSRLAVVDFILF